MKPTKNLAPPAFFKFLNDASRGRADDAPRYSKAPQGYHFVNRGAGLGAQRAHERELRLAELRAELYAPLELRLSMAACSAQAAT